MSFKDYNQLPEGLAFSNAGGPIGQYEKYDFTNHLPFGQGGGPVDKDLNENLNPRIKPNVINSIDSILHDPDTKQNIQKHTVRLNNITDVNNPIYKKYVKHYTFRSDNLNLTLHNDYRNKIQSPNEIRSHNLETDEDPTINLNDFDNLIESHKIGDSLTVYSGLHYHPSEYRGRIMHNPAYLSTSLDPHVAKDFGTTYHYFDNTHGNEIQIKSILRLKLNKNHHGMFLAPESVSPEQHEILLPRNTKYQLGQIPTHVINGTFKNHHDDTTKQMTIHIWDGRILKQSR